MSQNTDKLEAAMQVDKDDEEDEELTFANLLKNENQFHEEKVQRKQNQIEKL